MPPRGAGWVVAHLTGPQHRSRMSLQIGAVEATQGASGVTSKGALQLSFGATSAGGRTAGIPVPWPGSLSEGSSPALRRWCRGTGRLDVFTLGKDASVWHKAWAQRWHPSETGWEALGGGFVQGDAGPARYVRGQRCGDHTCSPSPAPGGEVTGEAGSGGCGPR
jgi:hypothetical protein